MSKWQTESRCVGCDHVMSEDDEWDSDGVCPHCGRKGKSRVYCDTRRVRFKMEQIANDVLFIKPPWWKFWAKPERLMKPEYQKKIHPEDEKPVTTG